MITYNGNEMMLQNDMGNTLIQDSKTGHIMGLSDGFVPVGLKEHGGIMYIASVNKDGIGEIGTIPSPILQLKLKELDISTPRFAIVTDEGPADHLCQLTNFMLYPGEKFLPILDINYTFDNLEFNVKKSDGQLHNIYTDRFLFSTIDIENNQCAHNGLYQLCLYSVSGENTIELSSVQKKSAQPILINSGERLSNNNFWFVPYDALNESISNIDIQSTYLDKGFHTYPGSLSPGKLYIKAQLERVNGFNLIKINQHITSKQNVTMSPYVQTDQKNDGRTDYILFFPGFNFQTPSCRLVGTVKVSLQNQNTLEYIPLCYYNESNGQESLTFSTNEQCVIYQDDGRSNYQIVHINQNGIIYPRDEQVDSCAFTPLFQANIGEELNTWYILTVKFFDQFEGYIDNYTFSFNPYHVLNYQSNYYNIEFKSTDLVPMYYDIASSNTPQFFFPGAEDITTYPLDDGNWQTLKGGIQYSGDGFLKYSGMHGTASKLYYNALLPVNNWQGLTENTLESNIVNFPSYSYKYLYGDTTRYRYIGFDTPAEYEVTPENMQLYNSHGYTDRALSFNAFEIKWTKDMWKTHKFIDSWINDHNSQTLGNNQSDTGLKVTGEVDIANTVLVETLDTELNVQLKLRDIEQPLVPESLSIQVAKEKPSQDNINHTNETINIYGDDKTRVFQLSMKWGSLLEISDEYANKSKFNLATNYVLYSDSEIYGYGKRGFDRKGHIGVATDFTENLYDSLMPQKQLTTTLSAFKQNCEYYPTNGAGGSLPLNRGVYLITVDAGPSLFNAEVKIQIDAQEYPLSRAFIVDSYNEVVLLPTLLYLPQDSIVSLTWAGIERLQGIGLYRVSSEIYQNDHSFATGSDIKLMYYQHHTLSSETEIILPCEAVYYESATCLDKEYDYYPGLTQLFHIKQSLSNIEQEMYYEGSTTEMNIKSNNLSSYFYSYSEGGVRNTTFNVDGLYKTLTYMQS